MQPSWKRTTTLMLTRKTDIFAHDNGSNLIHRKNMTFPCTRIREIAKEMS
jgi:hypothetical protein